MVNDTRSSLRKTKDDDVGSSKKLSSGKNDSSASVSGSMSGDASGLRRSTRGQSNSSPVNLRKSERLEKRTPPSTPSSKKTENLSPLRRSVRENKSQSLSSKGVVEKGLASSKGLKNQDKGSNALDSSKEKRENQDETLKEIAQEAKVQGKQKSSPESGCKRKKRFDARHYINMFKPLKKIKTSDSDRKTALENCKNSGDSGSEKVEEGQQEHTDGKESKGDNSDARGSNSDVKDNSCSPCRDEPCEFEGEALQVSMGDNIPSPSSPMEEAAKISDKTEEVSAIRFVMEKPSKQEMVLALNKLSDDGNASKCSQQGVDVCAINDVSLVSSSCKMSISFEECAKCHKKQRLEHDSAEQELCCCLSNTVNDMDDSKDRGQCGTCVTAEFAEKHGQNEKQSDLPRDVRRTTCVTCKLAGKLLHCGGKGCGRSYHPSCSLNPEENIYLPNWYCSECTKKRLALGVHSVSQGIESILDVRKVELPNTEGNQKQKQCFVKYKGLAHIHNSWVSEIQLLHEAPEVLAMFGKQKKDIQWNPAWAVPHRLLQRRAVIVDDCRDKPIDQGADLELSSEHEWLVKWCGLDYDQATWELEDSSYFKKPDALRLIEEYDARHKKARETPPSGSIEVQEKRKGPHVKLGRHSVGGADCCYAISVSKLRDYYQKGQNAVLIDEQDRFVKMIYLVTSLVTNISRPLLILTPHLSLSSWETEFVRLAASVNVVVYGGNADARNVIRSLEFYEEGGQMMFQVLLSSIEAFAEDVEELKGIEWEAVIVDDCQQSCISAHSGCIMKLAAGWRLLLINSQLEDNEAVYSNILSLLEHGGSSNQNSGPVAKSNEDLDVLKNRLSSFVVCARFLEYWVPVELSNLQLEQYCYSILSKSSVLRSFLKSDPVGSLREILISLRKCCDHPYIVDWQLQASLAEGLSQDAMMDLGIKASGKLHLLEKLLSEIKNQELKVLILFQSAGGSGRDTTANILEDFLRWRFGADSYEHVASGMVASKRQAACNQFNSLRERSFFLLETRACSPGIKLSLIDAVIVFDSDWNPHNDVRALQKIMIDTKLEQIKIFRLYCPYTVEEKVLILTKNDTILDSTLQFIVPSTSHLLLMWGSSYLFSRLDEFHHDKSSDCKDNIVFGSSFHMDVSREIISLFQNCKNTNSSNYITVARQNGGCYLKNIPLIGEQKIHQEDGMPPHGFWTKLLEGKQPQWKYLSGSSQRNRKRVHYFEECSSEVQSDEASRRRKKMDSTKIDFSCRQADSRVEKPNSGNKEHRAVCVVTNGIPGAPAIAEFNDIRNLHTEQRDLFQLLKPTILRLCDALFLKDDGKKMVEQFLEYLVKNYRVTRDPKSRLQAFLLSVCWTAAEELEELIDHKKSLAIVREKMGFNCSECEAEDIYSKLKPKIKMFKCLEIKNQDSIGDLSHVIHDISKGNTVESPPGNIRNTNLELQESSLGVDCLKKQGISPGQTEQGFEKCMRKVEEGCDKKLERLKEKHIKELEKFEIFWEESRMKLERWCKVESAAIRVTHANSLVGIDKLRALDKDYAKKREELEREIFTCRKELEAGQQIERDEEQKRIAGYMERVKSLGHKKQLEEPHAKNGVKSQVVDPVGPGKYSNGTVYTNGNLVKQQGSEREASQTPEADTELTVSVLFENPEDKDKQRENENDDSINALQNLPVGGVEICPPEQPRASTGQTEKDAKQVDDMVVDRSIALASKYINRASTTAPLLSPFPNQLTADMSRGPGDESRNGVEEQVSHAMEIDSTLTRGDMSSLNCSDCVPSNLPHNERTSDSTECSFHEWVTHSCSNDQITVAPSVRLDNPPSETHAFIGGTTTPTRQDDNSSNAFREAVSQPFLESAVVSHPFPELAGDHSADTNLVQNSTCLSVSRGAVPAHASHPNPVQVPVYTTNSRTPTTYYSDPLQIELDRISKEMADIMNMHESKKLQLKSECDKEIEEIVAQIRRKYEKKNDEAEASFSLQKNELEMCQKKVMMNKILAEAFRSKCTDYKATTRMQQLGMPSSSVESYIQLHNTRPFSATGAFSATSPVAGPASAAPPVRGFRPSTSLITQARIPHINSVARNSGQQQQARHEVRVAAPHIQPFRSASPAILSNSMPSGTVLISQPPNNRTSTSASQLSPQLPPLPLSAQLNRHGQSQQEESMGMGISVSLSSSATDLLMDIARRNDANLYQYSNNGPPLPDIMQNGVSCNITQFEGTTNRQPPSSSLLTGDVVCLSDDE